jgi:ribosome-binding factor A
MFSGGRFHDPDLQGVSITGVKMAGDLQLASIYFRCFDAVNKDAAFVALMRCKGALKSELAKNLSVRRIPELRFFYDESVEDGERIEQLLDTIANA